MQNPLHIFVDTNVWLAFYSYTNDDIEQLKIIVELIRKNDIKLYLTRQVVQEFERNREKKLNEAINDFAKGGLSRKLPRSMADLPGADEFKRSLQAFLTARENLVERAKSEAQAKSLAADHLFSQITEASKPIEFDDKIYLSAIKRKNLGNPPGKSDSLGDQLNWEILLSTVPNGADLHVISNDGDFESNLVAGKAHQFLIDEWAALKSGTMSLHTELRPFLKEQFPDIKLAIDVEKNAYIAALTNSGSFSSTHNAVAKLRRIKDQLTWENADTLVDAALSNSQVGWIASDPDVKELYEFLILKFEDKIDGPRLSQLQGLMNPPPWEMPVFEEEDEIPF